MSLVVEGQTYEWEGGTLEELLGLLAEAALSVRVEALHPDRDEKLGEINVVAGGVSDALAGDRRGDDAMFHLRQIPGLRFLVHRVLPNPEDGTLSSPGALEGSLADRRPPSLMRYCEEYVLTCALEMRQGEDHVRISYRRGEILRTLVNGSESGERLPEVMGWSRGTWRISLPQLALPRPPKPARAARAPTVDSGTLFGYQVQPVPAPGAMEPTTNGHGEGIPPAALSPPVRTVAVAPIATSPAPAPVRRPTDTPGPRVRGIESAGTGTSALAPTPMVSTPAFSPAVGAGGEPVATPSAAPPSASTSQPARPEPSRASWVASLLFHALLGVALGLAVVGGYWAFLHWGTTLRLN
jgi:hypothetical protein